MILGKMGLENKLKDLSDVSMRKGVGKGISLVQEAAKSNCPSHDGELRQSIYSHIEEDENVIRGICGPTAKHGVYVELGTGPKGQAKHAGISPEVKVAYTQSPWWIHEGLGENEIDRATAEHYHFFHIDTPQGRFYQCSGQAAQPYLYPALKDNEDEIVRIIAKEVKKQL